MASKLVSSVFRQDIFSDKVAIVTGGATGIGCAITQELLYLGKMLDKSVLKMYRL